ncbi:2-succinyl-5-enolpyruvyl-6-hydroxy-3-cyclohexene-1-carboxylic-acid synthase [Vibrio sp. SCSIO 43133]|uniref:2-succinyl-5-enolpyruvyl-6-hydroxy-3- cyclohexene-1-carboxylic-acid synthase n=1 Tax=Vibrio sp. SCSIO 43133 TaxID=2802577 RepID=UPI002075C639|nr:2-succinyl-5-enolpyruvyl-6-hydroxy-3-cyclohexene-1-carboxylic-acid synthase [Vibrio sp. SCSIO 43133]USE01362.1 2-succinyl-5-enolpyruvyl-6-hydroxy-3-cyclohexene-1-carboxylic-acid synthase [Vibrio sp. SCSIO 43133]
MSQNQAALNRVWTEILIEELYRQGVRHVCIAPGSRSTPLTLEAVAHPELTVHTHFDERGLGFLALGLAKSSQSPVAVIVTSGTAVANLLPAVAESKLTKEKLVLLTSDRPIELVECGANQAIVQPGIFSQHVTETVNLPSPTTQISPTWILSTVDHALSVQKVNGGSIHFNCPFPEPLYGGDDKRSFSAYLQPIAKWRNSKACFVDYHAVNVTDYTAEHSALRLSDRKGVIVVGSVTLAIAQQAKLLAQKLGWPILLDPQSGLGGDWQRYDIWLQNPQAADMLSSADTVLQVGARLVSKRLNAWLKQQSLHSDYLVLSEFGERLNPDHVALKHCQVSIPLWLESALETVEHSTNIGWGDELKSYAQLVTTLMPTRSHLTEFDVARSIERLPLDISVFMGNSLIVRLADMLTNPLGIETYSNRGASGIDGLVASANGVHRDKGKSMVLYLGDTSLLYDLNSLSLFSRTQAPCVIVVTNNDGGAIFDMLPVPQEKKVSCYQMPHGLNFEHAAAQFGLQYCSPKSREDLETQIQHHLLSGKDTLLIEVLTAADEVASLIRQLSQDISTYQTHA